MSYHHAWKLLGHFGQMLYQWVESFYGTAVMGLFVASYGCEQTVWSHTLFELHQQLTALRELWNVLKFWSPWLDGPTSSWIAIMETILPLYEQMMMSLPKMDDTANYAPLPDDPADWFPP